MGIVCRTRWTQAALASSLLCGPARALAQASPAPAEPPLRVLWTSEDPACDGDDVAARAVHLVTPGVVPRPLRASVEVRREGPLWVVQLETQSGEQAGHRILRAESCREIEDALALLLAMTMESGLDVPPPEALPPPAPAVAPTAAPPSPPAPDPSLADEPEPESGPGLFRGGFARLAGKAGLLQQPGLALGVSAAAGVRLGEFEVGVSGTHWPSTAEPIPNREGARLLIRRENLGLRGCWNAWRAGNFAVAPCVAPELTWFFYESEGLLENTSDMAPVLLSLGASAELRYELFGGAVALSLGVGVNVEKSQPFRLALEPLADGAAGEMGENDAEAPTLHEPVYDTKEIGPRLEIGFDARF